MAVVLTGLGFILPPGAMLWPLHNIISACVCIGVARLLQLTSLSAVLLALGGLVLYDVVAVSGTQLLSDNGQSVMEAVATAKLGLSQITATTATGTTAAVTTSVSEIDTLSILDKLQSVLTGPGAFSWRPGLLEVSTGGRVSDALGLGDVVFPAIFAGWALRYDNSTKVSSSQESDSFASKSPSITDRRSLYSASLIGYFIGCILCDVFMTGSGQPALLYIVPSMVASVFVTSASNGELQTIFKTNTD